MSNIYDVFNRKKGMDVLNENVDVEEYIEDPEVIEESSQLDEYVFESFEDPCEELDNIMLEDASEFVELQGDLYVADLVLENAMYDYFDEEEIATMMEASLGDRINALSENIQKQWAKIRAWFKNTIEALSNYFTDGEKLIAEHKSEIPTKMKGTYAKVKVPQYNDPKAAMGKVDALIAKLGVAHKDKDAALAAAGVKDVAGIVDVVKGYFIAGPAIEMALNKINPSVAMSYVGGKKSMLASINKSRAVVDKEFNMILKSLKQAQKAVENDYTNNRVAAFKLAVTLKTKAINTEIACVKAGASHMKQVIVRALGPAKKMSSDQAKQKAYEIKKQRAQYEIDKTKKGLDGKNRADTFAKYSEKRAKKMEESLNIEETLEFIDEE